MPKNFPLSIRASLKLLGFGLLVLGYLLCTLPALFLCQVTPRLARSLSLFWMRRYCKWCNWLFGIEIKNNQPLNPPSLSGTFIVANHLSYLDVLVMNASLSACFVTSEEIKETPFLGQLCILGGCLFVERRSRSRLGIEISEIKEALISGSNVVVFPEATSTNATGVLRFKRPLFQAAIQAKSPIANYCIQYEKINGEPFQLKNRDQICWYGDMDFFPHFWKFLKLKKIEVRLEFIDVIETIGINETHSLSELSHRLVSSRFSPIQENTYA